MNEALYIASLNENKEYYKSLVESLKTGGFHIGKIENCINDNDLYALDLTDCNIDALFKKFPWTKNEREHSKTLHLRILPLFVYSSKEEDPFEKWEEGANEIYEELFSEEFKPFAYDLANPSFSNDELRRVLSLYYVR